ncbi:MAG: ferredoxin [Candidatus Aenigmarchaeota archaeon ex4484_224]|nr:MAG: ferredoxin [Candidatus Aenigmarchaeota archaeon ex4484_224]
MKVWVDKSKCIGCGVCTALCPEGFEIGEDGKSQVKNPNANCNWKEIASNCPVGAIQIEED